MFRGCAIAVLSLLLGCGGSKSNNPPGNVTVTGQLQTGAVTSQISGVVEQGLSAPLAGYVLYCVTFGSPPVAASGTADGAGNVSVTLAAQGVAFGCFIQDGGGNTVATLSFTAAAAKGSSITLSGNTNLGTITVDLTSGLATANVSTGTVSATPGGSTCPYGTWIFQTGPSPACTSMAPQATAKLWVSPTANGGCCTVSLIHGPEEHNQGPSTYCSYASWNAIPSVYANGVLTIGPFNSNSSGTTCNRPTTVQMTPSSDCSTATAALHFEGCGACGTPPDFCSGNGTSSCGTATCNATVTGARQ